MMRRGSLVLVIFGLAAAPAPAGEAGALANASMSGDKVGMVALIRAGADPDQPGQFGTPALHWRVAADDLEGARQLIEAGADANTPTERSITPLALAIDNGNAPMVNLLLGAGAKATQVLPTGETALMRAAEVGEAQVVKLLLAHGAPVDVREERFGQTALMFAARAGSAEVVAVLLAAGAQPRVATRLGPAPAFIAPNSVPGFGFGVGIIRGGVPADRGRREPQPGGLTPLHYAARHGHVEVARQLIAAGAEVEAREANDITPLLMAISNNNVAMAHYLLGVGAEVNVSDWYGRTPLWEAVNVRNLYVHNATFKNDIDRPPLLGLIKALLGAGAKVNARTRETPPFRHHLLEITGSLEWVDFTGQTPFLTAALAGDLTVMKLLLEYGADPHIPTFQGTSPLMAAAGVNWVVAQTWTEGPAQLLEAVKMCHALGMDVNQANSMGITALHGAANRGSDDIIRFLVEKGADLTAQDNEKRTALDWAKGVFLATHPPEPKPSSIALITSLLQAGGKPVR
jgi:ankyrin repeat protein